MVSIRLANANWRANLPALGAFEAAARHLNFSKAARELGATQPAVSHQISWLEAELGCALFRRLHRGVCLTPEGEILFEAVKLSRAAIEQAECQIRDHAGRRLITIATDYGFAGDWLTPQLASLAAEAPDVEVRIIASQGPAETGAEAADFAIRMGNGAWPGFSSTLLFRETVFAVASPALLGRLPQIRDAREVASLPLLHLESQANAPWLDWSGWLAGHGVARKPRDGDYFFNTTSILQQAAIAGQGAALGWRPLIDNALATGRLLPVISTPVSTDMGYYLVEDTTRPRPASAQKFRDWLLNACAQAAG
jgi:putative choline sulfate-utilization transcription factor